MQPTPEAVAADACRELAGLRHLSFAPRDARGLLVAVHGISRNVRSVFEAFRPLAEHHGLALLAPFFEEPAFGDYQRLGRAGRGARADLALARLVDGSCARLGLPATRFRLFGYSGGAQFAHRFAMAHPHRVEAVAVCAAGWYTLPDPQRTYPRGIGPSRRLLGVDFEPAEFLRIPFHVSVGGEDLERDAALRRSRGLDRTQGRTRVERARRWCAAMDRAAALHGIGPPTFLDVLPGVGHSFEDAVRHGLCDRVFDHWLAGSERACEHGT
ncbi:MAG: hypothetical protein ACQGVC_13605 [Myxococcota bacterium]